MKEHPILFSGPMVRAILAERKTQTRRPMKYPPHVIRRGVHPKMDEWMPHRYTKGSGQYEGGNENYTGDQPPGLLVTCLDNTCQRVQCPFGVPGDVLWVRETFLVRDDQDPELSGTEVKYKATDQVDASMFGGWRPSIHMPRWASRISLRVTRVWVERVQEISGEDALAEGVSKWLDYEGGYAKSYAAVKVEFRDIWDTIYAKRGLGWDANPWVWAVEFEVRR